MEKLWKTAQQLVMFLMILFLAYLLIYCGDRVPEYARKAARFAIIPHIPLIFYVLSIVLLVTGGLFLWNIPRSGYVIATVLCGLSICFLSVFVALSLVFSQTWNEAIMNDGFNIRYLLLNLLWSTPVILFYWFGIRIFLLSLRQVQYDAVVKYRKKIIHGFFGIIACVMFVIIIVIGIFCGNFTSAHEEFLAHPDLLKEREEEEKKWEESILECIEQGGNSERDPRFYYYFKDNPDAMDYIDAITGDPFE